MFEGRRIAVFDLEIKTPIKDCTHGWQSHDEMGVSCMVVWDYAEMRCRVFDDLNISEAAKMLCNYDVVVGFNTVGFDWKVLRSTYPEFQQPDPGRRSADYDILREIWISLRLDPDHFQPSTHGGYKLDDVAFETIGMRKSGDGAHAPELFQAGKYAELIDYCIQDVNIERQLFEFVAKHGYVVRNGRAMRLGPVPIR
jgi:hypothetical protein